MPKLTLQRIPFTTDADTRLRMLKGRTGLTPNILARIGFCLSLEEPGAPAQPPKEALAGREINRYTLLGEYDSVLVSLLIARELRDGDSLDKTLDSNFIAHMNRGVELVAARTKSLCDLGAMCGKSGR